MNQVAEQQALISGILAIWALVGVPFIVATTVQQVRIHRKPRPIPVPCETPVRIRGR